MSNGLAFGVIPKTPWPKRAYSSQLEEALILGAVKMLKIQKYKSMRQMLLNTLYYTYDC